MSMLRLVMLGPPGAGKGTQAQCLERRYGARQISTGDILRRHRAEKTPLGLEAQPYMDRGDLVPDSIIIGMMETDLPRDRGFVLDGFPRTVPQAEALDVMLGRLGIPLTLVLLFACERHELITRLTGRWTNPRTGRVYHAVYSPPKSAGVDDDDQGPLVQRADYTLETVTRRLDVYERETAPLINFYAATGLLARIDAMQPVDSVTQQIVSAIDSRGGVPVS
jgi:adenylate kinase